MNHICFTFKNLGQKTGKFCAILVILSDITLILLNCIPKEHMIFEISFACSIVSYARVVWVDISQSSDILHSQRDTLCM